MLLIGDAHNFGKKVSLSSSGKLSKPRMIIWEELFLNSKSKLRNLLTDIFKNFEFNPTNYIPDLTFHKTSWFSGLVERFPIEQLNASTEACNTLNVYEIGSCVGLWCWLGMTDLHRDNIIFGKIDGKIIFSPIDLEAIFYNIKTLNDTLIFFPYEEHSLIDGICHILPFLKSKAAILQFCDGLSKTLNYLSSQKVSFSEIMASYNRAPCRVILKSTRDYYNLLKLGNLSEESLFPEEKQQLLRGDIPYFFKFVNEEKIYYFNSEDQYEEVLSKVSDRYFLTEVGFSTIWSKEKIDIFTAQAEYYLIKACL